MFPWKGSNPRGASTYLLLFLQVFSSSLVLAFPLAHLQQDHQTFQHPVGPPVSRPLILAFAPPELPPLHLLVRTPRPNTGSNPAKWPAPLSSCLLKGTLTKMKQSRCEPRRCESRASSRSSNYPTSDLQMQRFSCLKSLWHPCGVSVEHERTLERKKDGLVEVWSSSSSVKVRQRGERTSNKKEEKKPWAGRFKAASQSCWSGGSASVWGGFSPAGAAEQHASSSSSSCYPKFSSVTSLPYGPSPPLPLTHLCAEGRSISTCDIPTQERGRARER